MRETHSRCYIHMAQPDRYRHSSFGTSLVHFRSCMPPSRTYTQTYCLIQTFEQLQEAVSQGFTSARFCIPGWAEEKQRSFRATIGVNADVCCYTVSSPTGGLIHPAPQRSPHLMIMVGTTRHYIPTILLYTDARPYIHTLSSQTASERKHLLETAINMRVLMPNDAWVLRSLAIATREVEMEAQLDDHRQKLFRARRAIYAAAPNVCCVCLMVRTRVQSPRCKHVVACVHCICKSNYACLLCTS